MFTTTTRTLTTIRLHAASAAEIAAADKEADAFFAAEHAAKDRDLAAEAFAAGHCVPAPRDEGDYDGEDFANLIDPACYVVCTDDMLDAEDCPF